MKTYDKIEAIQKYMGELQFLEEQSKQAKQKNQAAQKVLLPRAYWACLNKF